MEKKHEKPLTEFKTLTAAEGGRTISQRAKSDIKGVVEKWAEEFIIEIEDHAAGGSSNIDEEGADPLVAAGADRGCGICGFVSDGVTSVAEHVKLVHDGARFRYT